MKIEKLRAQQEPLKEASKKKRYLSRIRKQKPIFKTETRQRMLADIDEEIGAALYRYLASHTDASNENESQT